MNNRLDTMADSLLDELVSLAEDLQELAHSPRLRKALADDFNPVIPDQSLYGENLEEEMAIALDALAGDVICRLRSAIRKST